MMRSLVNSHRWTSYTRRIHGGRWMNSPACSMPPSTTEEERSAAALVCSHFLETDGASIGLYALLQARPELKQYCKKLRARPSSLLLLFPEEFALDQTVSDHHLLAVRPADGRAGHVDEAAIAELLSERLANALWKYHAQRPSAPTEPVPLSWVVRTMPSALEAWAIASAEDLSRLWHLDPERFGHGSRPCAWAAMRDEYFEHFVRARGDTFVWHGSGDGDEPLGVALSAAEVSRRSDSGGGVGDAASSSSSSGSSSSGSSSGSSSRNLHEDLAATGAEGTTDLLLVRGSVRTAALFDAELASAAEYAGLPPHILSPLGLGIWRWQRRVGAHPRDGDSPDASWSRSVDALASLMPHLASVRCVASVVATAPTAASMRELLQSQQSSLRHQVFGSDDAHDRWSLIVEQSFPSADQRMLPFHPIGSLTEASIALAQALGGTLVWTDGADAKGMAGQPPAQLFGAGTSAADNEPLAQSPDDRQTATPAGADEVRLRLLQTKTAVVLLRDRGVGAAGDPAEPEPPVADEPAGSSARLPRWVGAWERRAFFFSSALDPLVALAAVNLALHTHLLRRAEGNPDRGDGPSPISRADISGLRVFDPCVGSGTVLAAAAARGFGRLAGADANPDFVRRASSNLEAAGLAARADCDVQLMVHDATTPYAAADLVAEAAVARTLLVVSNPPWGNNIGEKTDGVAIVRSVTRQFAGATFCWLVNKLAVQALRCTPGVQVLCHVPFGGVELVLCECVVADPDT
jgi:16S rRNA G966 N2-methylase RsmD